jgi:hypothetical protein
MPSSYPGSIFTRTPKENVQDLVVAEDVNTVYLEVETIERQLGVGGVNISPTWGTQGELVTATTTWLSLKERLANIEAGVYNAVSVKGSSVITPGSTTRTGLTLKAISGQTSNLLEVQNSSNTVVASINAAGAFSGVIDGGTA